MKLRKLKIQNFRKLHDVEILCDDATFLIGANNAGKTSTLAALRYLLSSTTIPKDVRSCYIDEYEQKVDYDVDVIIEGEFVDVSEDILECRGFNMQRLVQYTKEDGSVAYKFDYRVRLDKDDKAHREIKLHKQVLRSEYADCKKWQDYIDKGADQELFNGKDLSKKPSAAEQKTLEIDYPSLFEVLDEDDWFENPGGFENVVLSVLPKYIEIKADVLIGEVASQNGTLHNILSSLFEEVRENSDNYRKAVEYLQKLQKELDPTDSESDFGKLLMGLNGVVGDVFPNSSIDVLADLTKPETLKPKFDISIYSNIKTSAELQGNGLIRSMVFALLRFNQQWREKKREDGFVRSLIIGFEEPELFLHPNAANNMRNVIYDLVDNSCQIICTTHSPYMIDLSKSEKQVLNRYNTCENEYSSVIAFNHTAAFKKIENDDRQRVKMLQKIDDYVSRAFFASKVIVVEGDTEDIVFKKSIEIMPESVRKQILDRYQIIKASGKAVIISLVKYLKAMGVDVFVIHDEDSEMKGAEKMNGPILTALGNEEKRRLMMHNCIEEELGYTIPTSDKPYKAYTFVKDWTWDSMPAGWKDKLKIVFNEYADQL